jgi:lactoylglutathione lyase
MSRLAEVTFRVSDLQKAREFYTGVMGFEEPFQVKDLPGQPGGVYFKVNDDQFLKFLPTAEGKSESSMERVSLLTPDIHRARQMLQERKLNPGEIHQDADGTARFGFADPDATPLEFVEYSPGSLQAQARGKALGSRRVAEHLQHVGLAVAGEPVPMKYYREKLGFWETARLGPTPEDIRWINMMMPGGHGDYVELMVHAADPLANRQHTCFAVPDIQQTHQLLLAHGAQGRFNPFQSKNGLWLMNLRDPNGVRVEFMQAAKP